MFNDSTSTVARKVTGRLFPSCLIFLSTPVLTYPRHKHKVKVVMAYLYFGGVRKETICGFSLYRNCEFRKMTNSHIVSLHCIPLCWLEVLPLSFHNSPLLYSFFWPSMCRHLKPKHVPSSSFIAIHLLAYSDYNLFQVKVIRKCCSHGSVLFRVLSDQVNIWILQPM